MSRQVFPTAPSPTTTHLIVCIAGAYQNVSANDDLEEERERYTEIFLILIPQQHMALGSSI